MLISPREYFVFRNTCYTIIILISSVCVSSWLALGYLGSGSESDLESDTTRQQTPALKPKWINTLSVSDNVIVSLTAAIEIGYIPSNRVITNCRRARARTNQRNDGDKASFQCRDQPREIQATDADHGSLHLNKHKFQQEPKTRWKMKTGKDEASYGMTLRQGFKITVSHFWMTRKGQKVIRKWKLMQVG